MDAAGASLGRPPVRIPTTDRRRLTRSLWHARQTTAAGVWRNCSNWTPHARHAYSYIGMVRRGSLAAYWPPRWT
jgi:hypothetical protein